MLMFLVGNWNPQNMFLKTNLLIEEVLERYLKIHLLTADHAKVMKIP